MTSFATAAATSPPACPPMPSMTPNTPRAASTSGRSSLFKRTRPGCVRAAARNRGPATVRISPTIVNPGEPEETGHDAGQQGAHARPEKHLGAADGEEEGRTRQHAEEYRQAKHDKIGNV